MPTLSYFEQISFLHDSCLQIASLKKDRTILLCEILLISNNLTVLENKFNYARKNTDKQFSQNFSVTENIKELTLLIKKYKKLILLFRKYSKQLVEIELEIISIKSSTSSFESVSQ